MKLKNILKIAMYALLINTTCLKAQPIPSNFFGINGWMPDTVGTWFANGKFYNNLNQVKASNVKLVRYGGIGADSLNPKRSQYVRFIDSVRAKGMEPILQVSFWKGTYDSSQARALVKYINGAY